MIPGGVAKAAAKSAGAIKELGTICKNLQSAEKILVLEAVAEGNAAGANVGEAIVSANKTFAMAEELGLSTHEIATLKQTGQLQQAIGKGRDFFAGNPELQASYDLFSKAKETLGPYVKKPMPEIHVRNLMHQTGIPTFPKPSGIPENYLVRITEKGAGMEYIHPTKKDFSIRVMPGKSHSPNLLQQKPYVIQIIDNKAVDIHGNLVSPKSPEAHIPLSEFNYIEQAVYAPK